MNDKINDPQEKIETAIDSQELRDEELENVHGGAADDYFLKIGGIKGESIDERHDRWIDVLSFIDKSSPKLLE